jgi:hypothetical protein
MWCPGVNNIYNCDVEQILTLRERSLNLQVEAFLRLDIAH